MDAQKWIQKISTYSFVAFLAYITTDLSLVAFRDLLHPPTPMPPRPTPASTEKVLDPDFERLLSQKNIFNSDGKIPDAIGSTPADQINVDPEPVLSSLPLALVGTIVHANPNKSVGTINSKDKNEVQAYSVGDMIMDGTREIGRVESIERSKIVFRNQSTRFREYIELKDDGKITFNAFQPKVNGEVVQEAENSFSMSRKEVDKYTANLPDLLQQARAVPQFGADGQVECFRIADMMPGSIYERLGIKKGDCIRTVNGERVDSPQKAMEFYNALKGSNHIQLGVDRQGRQETLDFSITN